MSDDEGGHAPESHEEEDTHAPESHDKSATHTSATGSEYHGAPENAPCNIPHVSYGKESKLPKDLLMSSEGIIPISSGTNKFASQKLMTGFGVPRDVIDKIKSPNLKEIEGDMLVKTKEIIPLQMGTNKFASQKGQTGFGAVRDVLYKPKFLSTEQPLPEEKVRMSDGIIPLQMGTNKFDSQKGMTLFGTPRPVFSKTNLDQKEESQGFIHLQMGTNRFASQAGMTGMGMPRLNLTPYKDDARGQLPHDETIIPKQSLGCSRGASQRGMPSFGSFRVETNPWAPNQARNSQGFIPYQMGINWADSQAGKTGFGMPRNTMTTVVDETREPLPEDLANNPNVPQWSGGYAFGASQKGMTGMGTIRDVRGKFLRRLW